MIVVAATEKQWQEFTGSRPGVAWLKVEDATDFSQHKNADAFFSLKNGHILPEFASLQKPVFINSVIQTLTDAAAPPNVHRINGWSTFLKRPVWEMAGSENETITSVFQSLQIKINFVQDQPGFIAARVIAMIINEAYFALEDNVSSKTEIDTAMKLGTNYPYGPFEWASLIGTAHIVALLQKLYETDSRYKPCELLIKASTANIQ